MKKCLFLLVFLFASGLSAGDDIQAVGALWNDFAAALRRGDYRAAHGMFSAESRAAMPYAEFVREYAPASAAREMLLAKPESQSTRLDHDWAEIAYSGVGAGTGRPFRVGVSAVKNGGVWGLVAARPEASERVGAAARAVLAEAAAGRGDPAARRRLEEWAAAGAATSPVFGRYNFETDGESFRALPRGPGLRAFHLDEWGLVKQGAAAAPAAPPPPEPAPPASGAAAKRAPLPELGEIPLPPPPPPPPARPTENGLPELAEPPPVPAAPPGRDEMPEPPLPPPPPAGGVTAPSRREVEEVLLPDTI